MDDLILEGAGLAGDALLEIQSKRDISFSPKDPTFAEVAAQVARSQPQNVPEDRHLLAVATQRQSRSISGPYQDVLIWVIGCLPSREDGQDAEIAFRKMCLELRRRHEESLPILLLWYASADKADRTKLVKAISWMPEADVELPIIARSDSNPEIRELAQELSIDWQRQAGAVRAYRSDPSSLAKLIYATEIVDPEMLYRFKDEWSIVGLIQESGQQILTAEDMFVRRFNKIAKTSYKRVGIRRRTRKIANSNVD